MISVVGPPVLTADEEDDLAEGALDPDEIDAELEEWDEGADDEL